MKTLTSKTVLARVLIIALMLLTILPFLSMLSAALAPSGTYPNGLQWPADPQWSNFIKAFEVARMDQLLVSSSLIVLGVVPLSVLIATMAGYGLAKLTTDRYKWLYLVFVFGLTLPFEAVITPLYYEVRAMGLLNTRFAIILPLIGLYMPFGVYWMRAHFLNVPQDLSEAAQLDGATRWKEFLLVQVPLARPAIMSLSILLFLWTWNQFLLPVVLVQDPMQRTMAGALGAFQGQWGTDVPLLCAGSLLILTPTVLLFLAFQRQFVAALMQGAVKG
ncbi:MULTISPECIES: carbohydrate ABC transporter permease [Devosia]|jgi:raffinose/stachyose/melibiose transport system permease protein|uniref:Carbohydrate ABC transporter permease n=1 Tax=Devosia litorisediminis TaxID=2829817 RepID=A0A942IDB5_9HYPH|nr:MULTISPECIES: carbohydrate ABC transporter permease [Devosia]MBS3848499.1 carbohydrate ABC transporter permease [Devosia litorisediminis]MCZ4345429.1 carbohydrate ABC transporter permease [Devosia neptuniae]|tara:strand:+ start:5963 stop:6787 length:825 start_codon:yes stop_codon:yes gene_type:complete